MWSVFLHVYSSQLIVSGLLKTAIKIYDTLVPKKKRAHTWQIQPITNRERLRATKYHRYPAAILLSYVMTEHKMKTRDHELSE